MRKTITSGILFCLCSFSSPLLADVFYTYGPTDPITAAGPLPSSALNLTGLPVDTIVGNLGPDLTAVNVFAIDIIRPFAFSAMTLNFGAYGVPDTELFLFNSTGRAVYANDDISPSNTLSCLPAASGLNPCPSSAGGLGPQGAGLYFLAITRSNQLPWDASQSYLFAGAVNSTDVVGPDYAAGGANPVAGWDGGAYTDPNFDNSYYAIGLTGTTPEPKAFIILGAGVAILFLARRKVRI